MDHAAFGRLRRRIDEAFPADVERPTISLRGGNALDSYDSPPAFDPELDAPTAEYIETHHWGIGFLDPESWRFYLPILLKFALAHLESRESAAVDTFLFSLRPPDRDPPRFATLTADQRLVVVAVLEALGFLPHSRYQDEALQALQEYWHSESNQPDA